MTLLDSLYAQGARAFTDPRAAAADVLQLGVPRDAVAPALFLVVIFNVILNTISEMLAPNPFFTTTPFQMVAFLTLLMVVFSFAVAKSGQGIGGLGVFQDALLLMIFLNAIFVPVSVLQMVLFTLLPALAGLFTLAVMIFLPWVLINFIAALHGFTSLGRAVAVMVLAALLTIVALAFVAPLFVTPTEALSNV